MALHQAIQRLLLVGARLEAEVPPPLTPPPRSLMPLIESIAPEHKRFDQRALHYGNRYRSGFWAIYLLSAIAVLFAVLPLALGWDSPRHQLHSYGAFWVLGEVLVIGTVSAIYWQGHRHHWQEQWLRARTTAELAWYLPLLAPLLDFAAPPTEPNWYVRVFDPDQHVRAADDVAALCARNEPMIRQLLANAWSDPDFVASYIQWTISILTQQVQYHHGVAARQHALLHRVHALSTWLFGLTALGALLHLVIHTLWLTLLTTFFPALGASLHGALAQSEAYRLGNTSEQLAVRLRGSIERIREASAAGGSQRNASILRESIEAAIALILEEHQGWHLLVRPHQLPLG